MDQLGRRFMLITPSRPSLQPLISHCPRLRLSLSGQHLGISPGVYSGIALIHLLLLFKQPHLPGAPLLLPQHQYPRCLPLHLPRVRGLPAVSHQPIEIRHHLRRPPRIRRMRYSLSPPRQPIRIQDLPLGRGSLQG